MVPDVSEKDDKELIKAKQKASELFTKNLFKRETPKIRYDKAF